MKSKKKEQNFVGSYSLRKELSLVPSYLVLVLWVGFTAVILLWVIAASLSTTSDIFTGNVFGFTSGVHIENYARAWTAGNVSVFFMNSLIYSVISCALLILVCAPYSYVLQRFQFPGSKLIKTTLAATTGVPVIMVIIPLYMIVARAGLLRDPIPNRIVLIVLFVATKIPYTTIFLMAYFENISRSYEEAAAIDGCHPIFNFVNIWNEYFLSLMFVNSDSLRPVALGLFSMINSMQYSGDWSGLFASVIIVFLPTFILYVCLSKYIVGGLTGGVKG